VTSIEMYRDHILSHYRSPQNYGSLEAPDVTYREDNPLCGDDIEIQMRLEAGRLLDIRFRGQGCAISQAAASLLTENVKGRELTALAAIAESDVLDLLAIPISPVRRKCALLPLTVIQGGLRAYEAERVRVQSG
jgi:nitrogen fixation protein NifU and related proteins